MNPSPRTDDYTKYRHLSLKTRSGTLHVVSKPGLPDWETLLPSEFLLMETFQPDPGERVLLAGCHHGALAVDFSSKLAFPAQLTAADTNFLALECTRRTLELNQLEGANLLNLLDFNHQSFDSVALLPPRGRGQGRAWLARTAMLLRPGGRLYIAGANDEGVQSLLKDAAALLGTCETITYQKGSRVGLSIRPPSLLSPNWLSEPGIQPGTFHAHTISSPSGRTFNISSLPGVFSFAHLDPGSALLMGHLNTILTGLPAAAALLDVGCGYGILGMSAADHLPDSQVSMVDIDLAAIICAQRNIAANKISNAQAFPSDLLDGCANKRYDLILSNPPFHAGKQVQYDATHALIVQARDHLAVGGSLVLVANRFIRYEKIMQELFTKVEILAETPQYHLLQGSGENRIRRKNS